MTEFLKRRNKAALNPPDHSDRVTKALIADIDVVAERARLERGKVEAETLIHTINMKIAELAHET